MDGSEILVVALVGLCAGAINALAGGGPIIVVAALAALGLPATVASLTSTVALLPGQAIAAWRGRAHHAATDAPAPWRRMIAVALAGGGAGAVLLLLTPPILFARALPLLILFATALYAWHSRVRPVAAAPAPRGDPSRWLVPLAVYGGFYGGGNSFLVMALLAAFGFEPRAAAHAKNRIILLINLAAALVFVWSGEVAWRFAWPVGTGALLGGLAGAALIDRIPVRLMRLLVIALGVGLALFLALRG